VQPDGKILVGGYFTALDGQNRRYIGRLNADGTVDSSFNPGADNAVSCLAIQADGKILVGGSFTTLGGQSRSYIGRLNADGTVDGSFNPEADNGVNCLAVQADGKILVGGYFASLGGQSRSYIGRFNADGTVDNNFNPGADNAVNCMTVQADGKILAGGYFFTLGGQSRSKIGRLNADGTADSSFNPGADDAVYDLTVETDGKILVGGNFGTLGGQSRTYLGQLNADGTVDTAFNAVVGGPVYTQELQKDGNILVGGSFATLGGQNRSNIARLVAMDLATESLACDGQTVTWLRGVSSPEAWRTTFEQSDDGTSWTMLGGGTRVAGGWNLAGVSVTNGIIRARGYSGGGGISSSLYETVLQTPSIVAQPVSQTNNAGTTATFNVGVIGASPFGYQWFKGNTALSDGGSVSGSATATLTLKNVLGADAANYFVVITNIYGAVTSEVATLTLMPAVTPTVTWTNPEPITYGTALGGSQLNASASVPGTFVYTPGSGEVLDAGTHTLSSVFTPTDTTSYNSVTSSVSLVVQPAPLIVTANNATRPYGQVNLVFSGSFSGLTNNDNITASYNCAATSGSAPGLYVITPSLNDPDNRLPNYAVSLTNGTLTVTCPAIALNPGTLPSGMVGAAYSQSFGASGGASPYSFTVTAGNLPAGLSLSSGGVLSGTPSASGSASFTVTASDANGCTGGQSYDLVVAGGLPPSIRAGNVLWSNGVMLLTVQLSGLTNCSYILQTTTNLTPPVSWQPIFTNLTDESGYWQFTDTNLNLDKKFYRAVGQ
jgi:uncharacterized delta-60 repeat protein